MHMNQEKFAEAFKSLTPRRREVLLKLLSGKTDAVIAQSLGIHEGTVRKQIADICRSFDLEDKLPGERRSKRADLVALFAKYKPELLGECTTEEVVVPETAKVEETTLKAPSFVGREYASAHLNALVSQKDPDFVGRESVLAKPDQEERGTDSKFEIQAKISRTLEDKAKISQEVLFGVEEYIKTLREYLQDKKGSWFISVVGTGGIGKTSIVENLVRNYAEESGFIGLA